MIACNLHQLGQIKKDLRDGFGLQPRSGHHKAPHTRPEVHILLDVYRRHELHSRRVGRHLNADDFGEHVDGFERGMEHLRKTRLTTWVKETTGSRGVTNLSDSGTSLLLQDEMEGKQANGEG